MNIPTNFDIDDEFHFIESDKAKTAHVASIGTNTVHNQYNVPITVVTYKTYVHGEFTEDRMFKTKKALQESL